MKFNKFLPIMVLVVLCMFVLISCSGGKSPVEPAVNNANDTQQDVQISFSTESENRNVLAVFECEIDPEAKTFTVKSVNRSAEYHLPLTQLYPNVLQITNYGWTPHFWADIKLQHPHPGSGIDAFDPRVIAIIPANPGVSLNYQYFGGVQANNSVILEPDGYTKLFDSIAPGITGNANPFVAYFKDEPNRVWSSTETTEETKRWDMDLSGFGGPLSFVLVVDISTNYPNPSQPVVDNAPEPVQIETYIEQDLLTLGGRSLIEVTLLDWQGVSETTCKITSSELFEIVYLTYSRPGANPDEYIFSGIIYNLFYAPEGEYDLLVGAWDSPTGIGIYSETTVKIITSTITDGNLIWAKSAGGIGNGVANGITTLSDNSTVVTGYFNSSVTFGEGETNETILVSAAGYDICIARYNPDGTLAWAKRAGGSYGATEQGKGITSLSDDSTVMTGRFGEQATFGPGEINETVLTSSGDFDIFIACYNPDGTLAWAKCAGGTTHDLGFGISTLSDNSTVVIGNYGGPATFGEGEINETILPSYDAEETQIFIARYNPDGTLEWAKSAGGEYNDYGFAITSLSDDSTVVGGMFYHSAIFGEGEINETVLTSVTPETWSFFIARYNTDGTLAWIKRTGEVNNYHFKCAVTTLSDDSTVMTGNFHYSATFGEGEINETVLNNNGGLDWDIFIARYNPNGTLAWAKSAGGGLADESQGITALSDDSTVVTGVFVGLSTFGRDEINVTTLHCADTPMAFIARYNPDGSLAWAKCTGGDELCYGYGNGITSLSDDSTVVTGEFINSVTFGPGEPNKTILRTIPAHESDIFVARFQP